MMCVCMCACVRACVCVCTQLTTNHYRRIITNLVKTEPPKGTVTIIQDTGEYFCGFSKSFTAPPTPTPSSCHSVDVFCHHSQ